MKLCNDCDLNYRQSKNKRLLVELTLIQVAQLTAEPEDAGSGHGPKKQLSPVFHTAQASQPVAPIAQATPAATAPVSQPTPQPQPAAAIAAIGSTLH